MSNKDYSKLRPFDLEAARDRGEYVCFYNDAQTAKYIGQSSQDECLVCVQWMETKTGHAEGKFAMLFSANLRMAPLAWVRKSADEEVLWPVYKGDIIYSSFFKSTFEVTGARDGNNRDIGETDTLLKAEKRLSTSETFANSCTFTPPKAKRGGLYAVFEGAPGDFEIRGPFKDNIEAENARSSGVSLVTTFVREWDESAKRDDGWIEWNGKGGDLPIPGGTIVEVEWMHCNGKNKGMASRWNGNAIKRYRICSNQETVE